MLDRIVILSCRRQAYLIFSDRSPVGIYSSKDVVPLLMWFLGHPYVDLVLSDDHSTVVGIELRQNTTDEVTVKISTKDVA